MQYSQYTPLRQICHSLGTLWGHVGSKDGATTYKNPTYEIYVQTHHDHHAPVLICTCGHVTSSCLLACSPMAQWPKCQRVRPVAALPIPSLGHLVHQPRHPIGVAVRETRILFTPDLIRHQGSQMFAVFTMKNMLKSH